MTDDATLHHLLSRVAQQDRVALRGLYEASAGRLLAIVQRMMDEAVALVGKGTRMRL